MKRWVLILLTIPLSAGLSLAQALPVTWFYADGCHRCNEVKALIDGIEKSYAGRIFVERLEITDPVNYRRLMATERRYAVAESHPMSVYAGNRNFLGHRAILDDLAVALPDIISEYERENNVPGKGSGTVRPAVAGVEDVGDRPVHPKDFAHMTVWFVALGGLTDGINPCAFATVVFLISVLAARRLDRRRVLAAGLAFSAGVFIAYFLMGLGAFKVVQRLDSFHAVSSILYWSIVIAVVVLGLVSFRDALVFHRTGRAADLKLKIPDSSRRVMHGIIRDTTVSKSLFVGCLTAGMVVSVLEVVCTGQIYLPTIMVMIKGQASRVAGLLYLTLYNLLFIIPLVIVVLLFTFGVRLERFMGFSRKSVVTAKLLLGLFFLALAVVLTLTRGIQLRSLVLSPTPECPVILRGPGAIC